MELQPIIVRAAFLIIAIYATFLVGAVVPAAIGQMKPDWSRILSVIMIIILLLVALALPPIALTSLVALLILLGVREIWHAAEVKNAVSVPLIYYSFSTIVSVSIPYLMKFRPAWFHIFAVLGLTCLLSLPVILKESHRALDRIAWSLACILLSIFLSHLVLLRSHPQGLILCILVIFLTNISDMSGYFFGKLLRGRRKLIAAISPGKTIIGSLCSIPATLLLSLLFRWQLFPSAPIWYVLLIALVINIGAQLGDLIFSAFKRDIGIKDYSQLIPGHGGILDRFDSLVTTAPLIYCFVVLLPWPV